MVTVGDYVTTKGDVIRLGKFWLYRIASQTGYSIKIGECLFWSSFWSWLRGSPGYWEKHRVYLIRSAIPEPRG